MIAKMIIDIKFCPLFVFSSTNWANRIYLLFAIFFFAPPKRFHYKRILFEHILRFIEIPEMHRQALHDQ